MWCEFLVSEVMEFFVCDPGLKFSGCECVHEVIKDCLLVIVEGQDGFRVWD